MIKRFKIAALALLLTSFTYASDLKEVSSKEFKALQNIALIQGSGMNIQEAYDLGSIYIIKVSYQGKTQELFVTKDSKYIIAGNVMDGISGEKVSIPVDLSITKGKEAFTYGEGKEELVLFTDPECPYCRKFEAHFPEIKKFVKIKIFYFPLSFHANAKDISLYVMSIKDKEKREKAFLNTNAQTPEFVNRKISKDELAKLENELNEQLIVAQKLNIRGTPTLFDKNGKKVSWVELLQKYGVNVR